MISQLLSLALLTAPASFTMQPELALDAVTFELSEQSGEQVFPCTAVVIPTARDFEVTCTNPLHPTDKRHYVVHARIFSYTRESAPRQSYQILYWVTVRQLPSGDHGRYVGTTLWLTFDELSPFRTIEIGQDVETIWLLKMRISI